MSLARSKLTVSQLQHGGAQVTRWTNLQQPIATGTLGQFVVIGAETSFNTGDNLLCALNGLFVKSTKQAVDFHISLTPDGLGEWTYFHVTFVGKQLKGSYYYELHCNGTNLSIQPSDYTWKEGKKEKVGKFRATLSSGDIPGGFSGELQTIMRRFIGTDWAEGEAKN